MLVPLTSSLYVPGTLAGLEEVLVDIGTGFYVGALRADAHGPRRARVCVRGVRASSRELLPRLRRKISDLIHRTQHGQPIFLTDNKIFLTMTRSRMH